MYRTRLQSFVQQLPRDNTVLEITLLVGNLFFNITANASFKASAVSPTWRSFLAWQVLGNLAGLITVLTLTGLLHYLPLHVVFPVTTGMAVIGVQVVAAGFLFGETITPAQWFGTLLVVAGIAIIGRQ